MSWETKDLWPISGEPKGNPPKSPSPPLSRIVGFAGFGLAVFVSLRFFQLVFGLRPDFLEAGNWGGKETIALGVTLFAGLLGTLLGSGAGLYIKVKSKAANRFLTIFWHFSANGQVLAMMVLGTALAKARHKMTMDEATAAFGGAFVSCAALALILFLLGFYREGSRRTSFFSTVLSVAFAIGLAEHWGRIFLLERATCIIAGVTYGLLLAWSSAHFIERDYYQRSELDKFSGYVKRSVK